jgi:antitoxin ParD1/3/4
MESMQIDLPSGITEYVQDQVAQGGYRSPSEYIGKLILDDRARKVRQEVERKLQQGLDSGPPIEWTAHELDALKQRLQARHPEAAAE